MEVGRRPFPGDGPPKPSRALLLLESDWSRHGSQASSWATYAFGDAPMWRGVSHSNGCTGNGAVSNITPKGKGDVKSPNKLNCVPWSNSFSGSGSGIPQLYFGEKYPNRILGTHCRHYIEGLRTLPTPPHQLSICPFALNPNHEPQHGCPLDK